MIESSKSISVVTFQVSALHISELPGIGFLSSWEFFLTWNELSNQLEEKDGPEEREGGATRGKPLSRVLPLLSFTDVFNVFACVFSLFPLGLNSNHRTLLTSAASAAGTAAAAADGAAADGAPPVWMLLVLVA